MTKLPPVAGREIRGFIKIAGWAAAAACILSPSAAFAQEVGKDLVLRNPQNSVHVRIHPCGKTRCGTVVWANAKAKADSARGGTPNLVGTELFREFREVSPRVWKGKVFVPDVNRVFTGTGTVKDPGYNRRPRLLDWKHGLQVTGLDPGQINASAFRPLRSLAQ